MSVRPFACSRPSRALRWIRGVFGWLGQFHILLGGHTRANFIQNLMNRHVAIPVAKRWNGFAVHGAIRSDTGQIDSSLKTNGRRFFRVAIAAEHFQRVNSTLVRRLKPSERENSTTENNLRTRVGPMIMQTHRDRDMSSFASRPHDTELDEKKSKGQRFARRTSGRFLTLRVDPFERLPTLLIT